MECPKCPPIEVFPLFTNDLDCPLSADGLPIYNRRQFVQKIISLTEIVNNKQQ